MELTARGYLLRRCYYIAHVQHPLPEVACLVLTLTGTAAKLPSDNCVFNLLSAGWALSYDYRRRNRLAEAAMRDSEEWRRQLLLLVKDRPGAAGAAPGDHEAIEVSDSEDDD